MSSMASPFCSCFFLLCFCFCSCLCLCWGFSVCFGFGVCVCFSDSDAADSLSLSFFCLLLGFVFFGCGGGGDGRTSASPDISSSSSSSSSMSSWARFWDVSDGDDDGDAMLTSVVVTPWSSIAEAPVAVISSWTVGDASFVAVVLVVTVVCVRRETTWPMSSPSSCFLAVDGDSVNDDELRRIGIPCASNRDAAPSAVSRPSCCSSSR